MAQANVESGEGWLSFGPGSGTVSQESYATASVLVDAARLEPGEYHGSAIVFAPKSANQRQKVDVVLTVLPAGSVTAPTIEPAALLFELEQSAEPVLRTVAVRAEGAVTYSSSAAGGDGAAWCGLQPESGTVEAGGSLTVRADGAGLGKGMHSCSIRILFGDGTVRILRVVAVAAGEAGGSIRSPGEGFTATVGEPVNLEIETRGAGEASVLVYFSNGDAPLVLRPLGGGLYRGTWLPVNPMRGVVIESMGDAVTGNVNARPE